MDVSGRWGCEAIIGVGGKRNFPPTGTATADKIIHVQYMCYAVVVYQCSKEKQHQVDLCLSTKGIKPEN